MRSVLLSLALAVLAGAALTAFLAQRNARAAEAAHPPSGSFVEVDGARVHYVRAGSGPELVLIHGASGNLRDFTFDLMGRLTERYTVTAFDRPGLGYSDRVPGAGGAESPLEQARHLKRAAAALGIERPIVLGHSFGGVVALGWAVDDLDAPSPASARALVSLAGVAMPWPGSLAAYYRVNGSALGAVTVPLISAYAPESRVADAVERTFRPQPAPEGYAKHLGVDLVLRPGAFRANVQQVNTLRPHVVEMSRRYPELSLPVEIVHGDADETVPIDVHARPFSRLVASARLTELPGVGHMPHHVRPEEAVAAIDRAAARAK